MFFHRSRRPFSTAIPGPFIVHKRGADILHDPWFNKDTGFPLTERDRLGLRGLLPPRVISFEQQYDRFMNSYRSLEKNTHGQPDKVVALAKWRILNRLHDRNETLYYRVDMIMIVLTNGSRILGLGDLGVQGIGIPIGKLDIYVAAAGISLQGILPVMLDVGTSNQKLLEDHLGLRQPRLEGEEYLSIVDEFMEAVHARWPKAIVQGTAGVALAGILGSVRAQGRPLSDFVNQRIVVGLVTTDRNNLDPAAAPFAKNPRDLEGLTEGASIIEVVKKVRPHVLLGLSGVGGIFNEEVLKAMKESVSTKPAIFAMSSPTMNAECTAIDAFKHAGGDIVFGSGSPFENVDLGNWKSGSCKSGQQHVSVPRSLASYMLEEDIAKGILYPSIDSIRNVTAEVGAAVLRTAVEENLAEGHGDVGPKELGRRHGNIFFEDPCASVLYFLLRNVFSIHFALYGVHTTFYYWIGYETYVMCITYFIQ
ncbi:hypothetical protein Ahy_A01g000402 [Arachis hypogaea]|uniref:Malic enzyme n=1 Tax=Arachis hypogaea TaxID=3818 RepID=A0A445EKG3_ARAHY|nr:hypothetical protein Ahy_A01g000402 [Arachis hypogaea]